MMFILHHAFSFIYMLCVDANYSHEKDRLLDVCDIQLVLFGHFACIKEAGLDDLLYGMQEIIQS